MNREQEAFCVATIWLSMIFIALVVVLSGCEVRTSTGARVIVDENTRFAPTVEDTDRAIRLTAERINEIRPITQGEALAASAQIVVVYTSDGLNDHPGQPLVPPGYTVEGLSYGALVYVLCNEELSSVGTNSLVHELTHAFLFLELDEFNDHIGWKEQGVYRWVDSVKEELR